LRQYLNGEFFENTFTAAEKARIATTQVKNDDNQWQGTAGGNDTTDKVFLLSLEEVVKYFGDSGELANWPGFVWVMADQYDSVRVACTQSGRVSWWWLRSPGYFSSWAVRVLGDGRVHVGGRGVDRDDDDVVVYNDITYNLSAGGGVRPALWLNLEP